MAVGKQFGREASIYLVGFVAVGAIQFVALPIYSRALGPEKYGLYSLTLATTTMLAGVMVLGGDVALARFWVDSKSEYGRKVVATTWITFLTLWSVIVAALACLASPWLSHVMSPQVDVTLLLILGFVALVPAQLARMLAQILRNTFQPWRYSLSMVVSAMLVVGSALIFAIGLGLGVYGILLGLIVGESIGGLIRFLLVHRHLTRSLVWHEIRPLLRFGVPLVPASLASWVFRGADRLVLSNWVSPETLGHYGLAVSLVMPFTLLTTSLGQAWIPRVSHTYAASPEQARSATSLGITFSLGGLGAAAMLLGAISPWLVVVVGGAAFAESAEAVPFLALSAVFAGAALFTGTGLTLTKRTGLIPLVTVLAATIDFAALMVLVPRWGMVGAAGAVAIGFCCLAAGTLAFANRVYPLTPDYWRMAVIVLALAAQAWICTLLPGSVEVLASTVVGIGFIAVLLLQKLRARK